MQLNQPLEAKPDAHRPHHDLWMVTAEASYEKEKFTSEKTKKKQTFCVADPHTLMWETTRADAWQKIEQIPKAAAVQKEPNFSLKQRKACTC